MIERIRIQILTAATIITKLKASRSNFLEVPGKNRIPGQSVSIVPIHLISGVLYTQRQLRDIAGDMR